MQNVAGDETDLASVRNILLYWARPLEYAADEDQLQRHACLNRYIQSFVKERDEQEALRVYERQQAEALEQSRAELAAIEAAYPKPSINPYQAAAEAAQRRRQSQS
jgi:hypothetical protein